MRLSVLLAIARSRRIGRSVMWYTTERISEPQMDAIRVSLADYGSITKRVQQ